MIWRKKFFDSVTLKTALNKIFKQLKQKKMTGCPSLLLEMFQILM